MIALTRDFWYEGGYPKVNFEMYFGEIASWCVERQLLAWLRAVSLNFRLGSNKEEEVIEVCHESLRAHSKPDGETLDPTPPSLNSEPSTLNPKPQPLNPKP